VPALTIVEEDSANPPQYPTTIAVDPSGDVHVLYRTSAGLRHPRSRRIEWAATTVDALGGDPSLGIDAQGNLHLAYIAFSGWQLREGLWSSEEETWVTTLIASGPQRYTSLAAEPDGGLDLTYVDGEGTLQFLHRELLGAWDATPVDTVGITRSSLGVESSGAVHIAYQRDNALQYAHRDANGTWSLTTLDADALVTGVDPSLALDDQGGVHIGYTDLPDRNLRYAYRAPAGEWTLTTIEAGMSAAQPAIATDPDGNIHVSYRSDDGLRYATSRRCE
jgi:hypothetical protein